MLSIVFWLICNNYNINEKLSVRATQYNLVNPTDSSSGLSNVRTPASQATANSYDGGHVNPMTLDQYWNFVNSNAISSD
jgi:hypothetical protein